MNIRLLSIDTSTSTASFCIAEHSDASTECIAQSEFPHTLHHEKVLFSAFNDLCESIAISPKEIDAIVWGSGPGSFTGLRISLAFAKAYSVTMQIPIIGASLFNYVSNTAAITAMLAPCTRKTYFFSLRTKDVLIQPLDTYSKEEILALLQKNCSAHSSLALIGAVDNDDIYTHCEGIVARLDHVPIASNLCPEGIKKYQNKDFLSLDTIPSYGQDPQTDLKGVKNRPQFDSNAKIDS